jgi:hypothetical protein
VLPHTPGVTSKDTIVGYDSPPFTRISLSLDTLKDIDIAYAFVFGESKALPVRNLKEKNIPLDEQPSQILKSIPEAYLYSDQL